MTGIPVLDDAVDLALVGARRIAVVGASDDPGRASHGVVRSLLAAGYDVVPVNPNTTEVLGQRAYPDLASVPGRIDLVDVFRATEHLAGVAREAVARDDVGVVWNQVGLRSEEARRLVREAGRGYVEDRCLKVDVARRRAGPPAGPRLEHPVVLLDLDDTVLDHDACERAAVTATFTAFDLDPHEAAVDAYVRHNAALWEQYREGAIDPARLRTERWDRTLRELGLAADLPAISTHYLGEFSASGVLLPGAAEALWWIGRRSRVAVVTNGFTQVQAERLAATGVGDLLDAFVSSEEVGVAKPDPAALRLALERLGVASEDVTRDTVTIVGDQLGSDVAAGHAIGVHTVWIAPEDAVVPAGLTAPDVRVSRLADVA